ncbi:MAG: phasin family protein [Rhodospirillales bacterium]|nr:phasin family protein [Rhodospirillales bacterium]MBO6786551.1 phasin family protein [Rhodospirillales bacterium]
MATTAKKTTTTKAAPKAAPAPTAVEPVETAVKAGQETVETIVKTNTEVAKKGVEKAVAMTEEQFAAAAKASADAYKGYEDMIAFSKSNIEAFVKSNEILSVGVKEINTAIYKLAQSNVEESVALAQKIMGCTSVAEVVELQSTVAKSQYDKAVAESRKLSDQTIKLAEKASKPIAEQVKIAVETLSKPLAA